MANLRSKEGQSFPLKDASSAAKRQLRAADKVVDAVMDAVLSGKLGRGARLPNVRQMAEDFALSQPTIREAMRVLEYMSLIEVKHGSGIFVTGESQVFLSKAMLSLLKRERQVVNIQEIFGIRRAISTYSIQLVVDKASEENVDAISVLGNQLMDAFHRRDYRAMVKSSIAFQAAISAATHNPLLFALESFFIEVMHGYQLVEWLRPPVKVLPELNENVISDIAELVNALQSRDKVRAVSALEASMKHQLELFDAYNLSADIDISDSNVMNALADADLNIPSYGDFHNNSGR